MISGTTALVAHVGYPTHTFRSCSSDIGLGPTEPPMVTMVGVVLGSTAQAENYLAEFVERCGCPPARRTLDAVPPGQGLKRAVAKLDSVVSEASDTAATSSACMSTLPEGSIRTS